MDIFLDGNFTGLVAGGFDFRCILVFIVFRLLVGLNVSVLNRIKLLLFRRRQITVHAQQCFNPFFYVRPGYYHFLAFELSEPNPCRIVILKTESRIRYGRSMPSRSIFIFKEFSLFFRSMRFLEILIDAFFAVLKSAAVRKRFVDFIFRDK